MTEQRASRHWDSFPKRPFSKTCTKHSAWLQLQGMQTKKALVVLKTEIRFGRDHTDSIGVAHATTPALDTDDWVTARKDAELNALLDTPF